MGADLYLPSVLEKQFAQYKPHFDEWVQRRDALLAAGKEDEAQAAQVQVLAYDAKMYARGYFRDSYNNSNLLWLCGLSWWGDVLDVLTDGEGQMSPANAGRFLQLLREKEPVLNTNLAQIEPLAGETLAETRQYFSAKYQDLQRFLQEAIDRDEAIDCSL